MRQHLILLTSVLLLFVSCQKQIDPPPLLLVKNVFSKDSFPDLDKHIAGEYNGHPNGNDLPINSSRGFLLLHKSEKSAVVNLTITDSLGYEFDTYVHLKKDSLWKIIAFRGLAMAGFIKAVHKELKSMTDIQIDSIIELSKNDTLGQSLFKSRIDYQNELGMTGLITASDNKLIAHFKKNKIDFNVIKDSILTELDTLQLDHEKGMRVGESFKANYNKLFISSIDYSGLFFNNVLKFKIGGMIDNTVGYLFVQDKNNLPIMNPGQIIMIREIGDGWYLYKTT